MSLDDWGPSHHLLLVIVIIVLNKVIIIAAATDTHQRRRIRPPSCCYRLYHYGLRPSSLIVSGGSGSRLGVLLVDEVTQHEIVMGFLRLLSLLLKRYKRDRDYKERRLTIVKKVGTVSAIGSVVGPLWDRFLGVCQRGLFLEGRRGCLQLLGLGNAL